MCELLLLLVAIKLGSELSLEEMQVINFYTPLFLLGRDSVFGSMQTMYIVLWNYLPVVRSWIGLIIKKYVV